MSSNPTISQNELVTPLLVNSASYFLLLVIRDLRQAGFSVIVLDGKPLKAKGPGNIISFELKLVFCSFSVVSVFFLILLEKSY